MKKLGYISIVIVSIAWGISFVATKIALEVFNPLGLMFFKFLFSTILFMIIMKISSTNYKIKKPDRIWFLLSTVFGFVLYFIFEGIAIDMLNASSAALILAFEPVVIMVMSYIFLKEKLSLAKKAVIPATIIGVYLIVFTSGGNNELLGYMFMFLAIIMWGAYVTVSSKLTDKYSVIKITGIQATLAFFIFVPFIFTQNIDYTIIELRHVLSVVYLGVVPTGLALLLYIFSLKAIGSTTSSLFVNFVPVVTAVLGVLFLQEVMTLNMILGGLIIVVAITFTIIVDLSTQNH